MHVTFTTCANRDGFGLIDEVMNNLEKKDYVSQFDDVLTVMDDDLGLPLSLYLPDSN